MRVSPSFHVAQMARIASMADSHFRVGKLETGGRTRVEVETLIDDDRLMEIARMMGGKQITDATLAHAREMLMPGAVKKSDGRKKKKPSTGLINVQCYVRLNRPPRFQENHQSGSYASEPDPSNRNFARSFVVGQYRCREGYCPRCRVLHP